LYTGRVIGEDTLSNTRALSLRHSAARFSQYEIVHDQSFAAAEIAALLGHIGSHMDITSGAPEDQAKYGPEDWAIIIVSTRALTDL
jgi:hypothetical protein